LTDHSAARWKMKPEQIECLGCKSDRALFSCTLKKCASKRGLPTCAHCPEFPSCRDEQWTRYPRLRETAAAMRCRQLSGRRTIASPVGLLITCNLAPRSSD